jgi:hypothetical protein
MRRLLAPLVLLAGLAFAAPAQAAVTASVITTPKSPHFVLSQGFDNAIEVAGRATGIGNVDIVCTGVNGSTVLETNVQVAGDGTFRSAPVVDPLVDVNSPINGGQACRLHAVPTGETPAQLTLFRGPLLAVSLFTHDFVPYGPNAGLRAGYRVWAQGADRATRISAFGHCSLYSVVLDPVTLQEQDAGLACAGSTTDSRQVPLASVRVDGQAAYPPAQASTSVAGFGTGDLPGMPSLPYPDVELDETTGAVAVTERNPFVKCGPDATYPPTQFSCTSFAAVPAQLERTTTVLPGDHVVRVVDRWSSTDGQSHRLDLALQQARCCHDHLVFRFPGESAFARHDAGDTVHGPLAASPIQVRAEDGTGTGVLVLPRQPADGARFVDTETFALEYTARTIPATGALTFTHYYVTTRSVDELDAAAAKLIASLATPAAPAPAPHGTGGQTVTPPAPPRFSRAGRVRVRRIGRTFRVTTSERVTCAMACDVQVHGRRIVPTDLHVAPGRTEAVRFRLTRGGARKLRRTGRLRVTVSLRAGTATAQRTLTLRAPA